MRTAILDFGTNTFNLLIAELTGNTFRRIYTGKQPVKLGKGGINEGLITEDAMKRGLTAIARHMETIADYDVDEVTSYATSAFRNATNGKAFARTIEKQFGFTVHIIPGDEEADLIYRGIRTSVAFGNDKAMIMDIGGGSNELIICDEQQVFWKQSFELGMARILERFTLSDPITIQEKEAIETYFRSGLQRLFEKAREYRPKTLLGASGSFDTLAAMLRHTMGLDPDDDAPMPISLKQFAELRDTLLSSTIEERRNMPGMEPVRVEMIVPAVIFINLVVNDCGIQSIVQSDYALKEGVVARRSENMK